MVKQQLRTGDVLEEKILHLFEQVPRSHFVPEAYSDFAYSDMQVPLPHGQRMLTPLEEGIMLQALDLKGAETVLEIGTGTGFFTALLSKLCKQVISVEYFPEFTAKAARKLETHHCNNVTLITGDASRGWLEQAPYDAVVFTGALETISKTQLLQVMPGGRLIAIVGKPPIMQVRLYKALEQDQWEETLLSETLIPELINQIKPKEFVF